MWLFSTGNGTEIRPLEMGRKSPDGYYCCFQARKKREEEDKEREEEEERKRKKEDHSRMLQVVIGPDKDSLRT